MKKKKKQSDLEKIVLLNYELIKANRKIQALEKEREDLYRNFKSIKRYLKLVSSGLKEGDRRIKRLENEVSNQDDFVLYPIQ